MDTFGNVFDESYDLEVDNYIRIEKITQELKKLCDLPRNELLEMHREMQDILEFNYHHFFNDFRRIITEEMVDNFCGILSRINNGRNANNPSKYHQRYDLSPEYVDLVKRRLLQ